MLEKAQKVVEGLNAAEAAQIRAEGEIQTANNDIGEINKQLSQVTFWIQIFLNMVPLSVRAKSMKRVSYQLDWVKIEPWTE